MKHSVKKSFMLIMVTLALIVSVLGVTPAFADDETPPAPATEEAVQPPVENPVVVQEPVATEPSAAPEPVATEPPATTEPSAAPEAPASSSEEPAATVTEVVEQLPADTTVVVLDGEGENVPLASQAAANAFVSGDPMWCPDGVTPGNDPDGKCTPGQASFNDLIDLLTTDAGATYSGAGTIYVAWDYDASNTSATYTDAGTNITFDYDKLTLTDLIVQGGWVFDDPATPEVEDYLGTDPTTMTGVNNLQFVNWGGNGYPASLTLNDLVMDGGWLLIWSSEGDVALNNVSVLNGNGVYINQASGDVTINGRSSDDSSDFTGNGRAGLQVMTTGNIDVSNVNASGNNVGVYLNSWSGWCGYDTNGNEVYCSSGDVSISNSTIQNNGRALIVNAEGGNITLSEVTSSNTIRANGADLSASGYWCGYDANGYDLYCSSGNIFVENSTFDTNLGSGVYAATRGGDMFISGVTSSQNGRDGATLISYDTYCGYDANGNEIDCSSGSIFVENSTFTGNASGVSARTYGGDILLDSITADKNIGLATNLKAYNYWCGYDANGNDMYCSSGSVYLAGGTFNGNAQGVSVSTEGGDIVLEGVTASGNTKSDGASLGAYEYQCGVDADGNPVPCSGNIFIMSSTLTDNSGNGASVWSSGDVWVECSQFNSNGMYGINASEMDGSLTLDGANFDGMNGSGDYSYNGTATINNGVCKPVFSTGGSPNESRIALYRITQQTQAELPGMLGEGNSFGSALKLEFTDAAAQARNLKIMLSFPIPTGMQGADLAVLFWDGSAWVEMPGGSVVGDYFVITVTNPGVYVLVSR